MLEKDDVIPQILKENKIYIHNEILTALELVRAVPVNNGPILSAQSVANKTSSV